MCVLWVLAPSQQTEAPDQKPLVHAFAKSDGSSPAAARLKARLARAAQQSTTPMAALADAPAVDLAAMRAETEAADAKARGALAPATVETAPPAPTRIAAHATGKRTHAARHASKKSRRPDAYGYWGSAGAYSWGYGYGYGGRRGYYN
jgi:hypothetical protein